ncbi:D-glycerate dehydrogenase [Neomegalonema sp.]|uniref:2-hydroxyacid dehydrogenase n=1 Tax=Neomegalonema sp. TaxID=2039713 RepID=UPI002606F107|nr:D-glycerate dehydrogenase [Neomegalonema sp.]MDD2869025.1 D-glycerate dehydrogenase [Neomegalonema sp.]
MPAPRPKARVIVTRKLPDQIEARLGELFDVELNPEDKPFTREQLHAAVQRAEVLAPTLGDPIDGALLASAGPQMRMIANFGAGVDHIDVKSAVGRGITVSNTPGVLTDDTADLAMALILAAPRRLAEGVKLLQEGRWTGWTPTFLMGRQLKGKKLGILGMGRIGQALAHRARAFGLEIHYHNRKPLPAAQAEELGATHWPSLDQMLARVDILSVNCPYTPATYHLLSSRSLKLMKPEAYIVNTARGEIIDENALIRMLEAGELAGAALDVFEDEPYINPRLRALPNVFLLPHMGSATLESRVAMGEKMILNIHTFLSGHTPPDKVLLAAL